MNSRLPVCQIGNWVLAFAALVLPACSSREYSLADVSGTVTLDGKPLADATVTFVPVGSGVGPASMGFTDENGHYELRTIDLDLSGVVPGTHRVAISTARADQADERATFSEERVPPQFRDGSYHFEVEAEGTDGADIEIQAESKTKRRRRKSRR